MAFWAILLLLPIVMFRSWVAARATGSDRNKAAWLFLSLILLLYLAYALGTDSSRTLPLLKLTAYVLLPAAVLLTIRQPEQRLLWQDVLIILALWLPLDFRWMRDVWGWPSSFPGVFNEQPPGNRLGSFPFRLCAASRRVLAIDATLKRRMAGLACATFCCLLQWPSPSGC